jgi:hypothetical protein
LRTSENPQKAKFAEFFTCELRRIPILGRWAILSATRVSFLYLSGGSSNRSILSGFCSRFSSVGSLRSRLHSCLTSVVKSHNRADQPYERRQENCPDHRNQGDKVVRCQLPEIARQRQEVPESKPHYDNEGQN